MGGERRGALKRGRRADPDKGHSDHRGSGLNANETRVKATSRLSCLPAIHSPCSAFHPLAVETAAPVRKSESQGLSFYYGEAQALKNISMPLYEKKVTALIGPSGCGKSTYLRCFNRMHDLYPGNRYEGRIVLYPDNTNLLDPNVDPIEVRMRISMVFQKPNPFPKSIYENVAYGLRVRGVGKRALLDEKVEEALRSAAL